MKIIHLLPIAEYILPSGEGFFFISRIARKVGDNLLEGISVGPSEFWGNPKQSIIESKPLVQKQGV